jgi:putative flippase GtrA
LAVFFLISESVYDKFKDMKKIDIVLALVFGEIAAWFFYGMLKTLDFKIGNLGLILAVSLPSLSVLGLWVCWLLSKKFLWIWQLAKYLLIGVMATILDLGILNGLISLSGLAAGIWYSVFKGISFIAATCGKYFADKLWAFEKTGKEGIGKEFSQFFLVTLVGLGLNVAMASFLVNSLGPQFGLNAEVWANIGGIGAAFAVTAWNFVGYKFIVFKK